MGAKFDFFVVGKAASSKAPAWSQVVASNEPVISRVVGPLTNFLLLDLKQLCERRGPIAELNGHILCPNELLSLYPPNSQSGIAFSFPDEHWEFCLFLPVQGLSEETAEQILTELWNLSSPLGPLFAAAGEELEVWDSKQFILDGRTHPLDVPLCSIAVVSNGVEPSSPVLEKRPVPGGVFCRGSYQLKN